MLIQDWIDKKLTDIASKLPTIVYTDPASFAFGFNVGYKEALLDLDKFLDEIKEQTYNNILF